MNFAVPGKILKYKIYGKEKKNLVIETVFDDLAASSYKPSAAALYRKIIDDMYINTISSAWIETSFIANCPEK